VPTPAAILLQPCWHLETVRTYANQQGSVQGVAHRAIAPLGQELRHVVHGAHVGQLAAVDQRLHALGHPRGRRADAKVPERDALRLLVIAQQYHPLLHGNQGNSSGT
jgi:hypothetical protein